MVDEVCLDVTQSQCPSQTKTGALINAELYGRAVRAGIDGWIAPVNAAGPLRAAHGPTPILTCPGIRLPEGETQDQVEIGTPEAAVAAGADWIVVGRPITRAKEPLSAAREILRRLGEG